MLGPKCTTEDTPPRMAPKKPKARIYGLRSVTVPFIAYVAVIVRPTL